MTPFQKDMAKVKSEGEKAAKGVQSSFKQLGQRMRRTGTIMTAAVTAPVVAGFAKMSKEAALLEGGMAKFNVVFGDASDQMEQWVNEFRKEVPLARTEIIKAASAMQDLLVPMGIARDEATGMSKQWLTLASRLAAFNDVPVDQALEAIRSGIAGMSRPLRQFGIDARETVLQQVALQEGIIESGEAMDEQARQQALLIQAYDQSSDALDGFEEQQDSLLLMQQEVSASVRDLAADYGKLLIPAAKSTAKWLSDLAKTMQGFSDTTKQVIMSVTGLAAAIGPAALGLGWAIKLAIPAVTTLTKVVKGLTAAMIKNPYLAVGAALAYIGGRAIFARMELNSLHAEVQTLLSSQDATLGQVNKKIAELGEEYSKAAEQAETIPGMEAEDLVDPQTAEQLQKLIKLRDKLASQSPVNPGAISEMERLQVMFSLMGDSMEDIVMETNAMNISRPFVEAKKPVNDIIQGLGMAKQKVKEITDEELMNIWKQGVDVGEKIAPPGSMAAAQERVRELREEMRYATDPETVEQLRAKIDELTQTTSDSRAVWQGFANTVGSALQQAVIHGKELGSILASLAKQLSSKAIMTGLSFLLPGGAVAGETGFFEAMFGGIFHEGGIVGGNGDVPIVAQAGEGVFTKGQMEAMGGLIRNGGGGSSMDERTLQRAFDRALGKHLQRLGNDEIYAMAQKGRRSY